MKFPTKTLGLLLASLTLASCGGGGSNGGAFSAPQSGSITLTADRVTLPLNTGGELPAIGSPYMASVSVSFRSANGTLEAPTGDATYSIDQPNIATLSQPDDPATTDVNEFTQRYVTFHAIMNNGSFTVFVNSLVTPGTAILTASAVDPQTNVTVTKTLAITVASGIGPQPANVTLSPGTTSVYLPDSGGGSTSVITALVTDGAGVPVANPTSGNSGVDNVQFEIVGSAGDATLSTQSVAGPVTGTSVTTHTINGVATASFQAGQGTPQGPVQIRVTADSADNNVSNQIQNPVASVTSLIVSDGKLYSIHLTSPLAAPNLPGITINCVTDPCAAASTDATGDGSVIPSNPDATLSLVVTAKAQDRQGNPVLPGTAIRFGSVDEPVGAPGSAEDNVFLLSGYDGNPQEGGTLFTAPTGQFTTAGGGAGPGDALVVFGKSVEGNADLTSAVTVAHVNSATSLNVTPGFNLNDTTGVSVDYGSVLPYLIGRSLHGSITAVALTDADLAAGSPSTGVAHAVLTYTASSVGNSVAVWAQGDGVDRITNGANRVTDAGTLTYPGVAPISIVATPNPIVGDVPQTVTVCVTDALGIPLRGLTLGFKFMLTSGTGSVDGTALSGGLGHSTGVNGCVDAAVATSGLPISTATGNSGTLTFSAGSATAVVDIIVQLAALQGPTCEQVTTDPQTIAVSIRALTTGGTPASGVAITATCTPTGGTAGGPSLAVTPASATTSATGTATFSVVATGFTATSTTDGQCVFSADASGTAALTVPFSASINGGGPSPGGGCN